MVCLTASFCLRDTFSMILFNATNTRLMFDFSPSSKYSKSIIRLTRSQTIKYKKIESVEVSLFSPRGPPFSHNVDFTSETVELPLILVLKGLTFVLAGSEVSEDILELSLGCREVGFSVHYD